MERKGMEQVAGKDLKTNMMLATHTNRHTYTHTHRCAHMSNLPTHMAYA